MKRVYFVVEGQTEEQFVNEVLRSHFDPAQYDLRATIVYSKKLPSGKRFKGGNKYEPFKRDLTRILNSSGPGSIVPLCSTYFI